MSKDLKVTNETAGLEARIEELERIIAERNEETKVQVKPTDEKKKSVEAWLSEKVPFYAFGDNERYKDDLVVSINGFTTVMQRGKQVMIPRHVHMALMDANRQQQIAYKTSQGFIDKFKFESNNRGIA